MNKGSYKHGHSKRGRVSTEYRSWAGMKNRCLNENQSNYPDYGGRGVTICPRWIDSFETFLEDMGEKPAKGMSLDRIDNGGNYNPSNCRWATRKQQNNNQRGRKDNKSGVRGVNQITRNKRWVAKFKGKQIGTSKYKLAACVTRWRAEILDEIFPNG